ncbi:hypothetical protein bpr_II359 (plasmid) [Butyrivibrio proteoclasticus B316]|uniref:Uncharacterized protein n=1 Tax=Butyrivibrio proteoclasticus (strain ATCC 51982 / DSM 14932 / B316) TaxID=515622 RepID=E0S4G4_BUTPB|nr:hypothetical protein [Butyrivibrio proteoclasticus]ADL36296.1 hypothetical protein bpr_II359 [Butyrivibrio proteoclasticus B316]
MQDITLEFKDITEEYPEYAFNRSNSIRDEEFANHKCTLFMDMDGNLIFVGYIRTVGYPTYVIKTTEEEIKDKGIHVEIANIAKFYLQNKRIYHANNSSRSHGFTIGTYGMVYHKLITIATSTFEEFPSEWWIVNEIENQRQAANFFSEYIDWNFFAKKMNEIDEKATHWTWGYNSYPSLMEFLPLRDRDFTFLMLSNDENVKKQYMRFINHLEIEHQADGALR